MYQKKWVNHGESLNPPLSSSSFWNYDKLTSVDFQPPQSILLVPFSHLTSSKLIGEAPAVPVIICDQEKGALLVPTYDSYQPLCLIK